MLSWVESAAGATTDRLERVPDGDPGNGVSRRADAS